MDYTSNYEHSEDYLPVFHSPISILSRQITHSRGRDENIVVTDYTNPLIEDWKSLYEKSLQNLKSGDEDDRPTTKTPSNHYRQPSVERSTSNTFRPVSPEMMLHSNQSKSKWDVRLHEPLKSTIGPDRQSPSETRRRTNIVFLPPNPNNGESDLDHSLQRSTDTYDDRPTVPLVKQLREKFDQMSIKNQLSIYNDGRIRPPSDNAARLRRLTSLTRRDFDVDTSEHLNSNLRLIDVRSKSFSDTSSNNQTPIKPNYTRQRKASPPVSYPRHVYPRPSPVSVVKQLIDGGATLVYDSIEEPGSTNKTQPINKQQINVRKTAENLETVSTSLSGRQKRADSIANSYKVFKHNSSDKSKPANPKVNESNGNYYDRISMKESSTSSYSHRSANLEASRNIFGQASYINQNSRSIYNQDYDNEDD